MGSLSDDLELIVLDTIFGGDAFVAPSSHFVALFTDSVDETGSGTEVSGGSYVRVEITNDSTTWPAASLGQKANGIDIIFPEATANWGTVVSFAIFDDLTAGTMIGYGDLGSSVPVNMGVIPRFPIGSLVITAD